MLEDAGVPFTLHEHAPVSSVAEILVELLVSGGRA